MGACAGPGAAGYLGARAEPVLLATWVGYLGALVLLVTWVGYLGARARRGAGYLGRDDWCCWLLPVQALVSASGYLGASAGPGCPGWALYRYLLFYRCCGVCLLLGWCWLLGCSRASAGAGACHQTYFDPNYLSWLCEGSMENHTSAPKRVLVEHAAWLTSPCHEVWERTSTE